MTAADPGPRARLILPPVLRSGTPVPDGFPLSIDHPDVEVAAGVLTSRVTTPVVARVAAPAAPGASTRPAAPAPALSARSAAPAAPEVTDTFEVTVLPAGAPVLLAGTRRPDPDPASYAPRIAFSLHLALATPDGAVTRLNDDRGVLFPRAVPAGRLDTYRVRTLTDPWVFAVPGGYVVVASPALSDGSPEPPAASAVLLFTSPDLVTYREIGLVRVAAGGGVRRPRGVYDGARAALVLWWTDDEGRAWSSRATTPGGPWAPAAAGAPMVPGAPVPDGGPGHVLTCALPLDEPAALRLRRRYGRVRNVAVRVPPIEAPAGAAPGELPWALLTYDDGSTARRPVDWDPASLAGVGWDRPGEYVLTGTVRQRVYPFPFVVDRADPTVLAYRGRYYFIATDDTDGDCVSPKQLLIRVADSIAGLATAPDHAILSVGPGNAATTAPAGTDIAGCFWAPELHVIGGRLCCLFAPSVGAADWTRVRCHVLRLRAGGDPVVAADWEAPRLVLRADGAPLQRDAEHPGLSLDMTYLRDGGRSYVIWSQRYVTDHIGDAELWIATIDPAAPWRLSCDPVRIVTAEYGWDHPVAEGPFALRHGDRLAVTYSGSQVGPTYAVGMIEARSGADLLDPGVWTKAAAPVLGTGSAFTHWGPGHNTFSRDEDGLELVVFHAHPSITARGRCAALRRIHWAADGHLVLDQRPDEEVAPHLRRVRAAVRVTGPAARR
ncbi:family 43 glycosylhydrolase [Plantactinospora siamensis]|uniref:Family 43 glycosylhydrolase n=1 Tax=Plantactinospora siamensis TaxID=555372 RepID=A0ABV6P3Q4_9ACTN